jgi:galactose mutarotase-like enzyme
MYFCCKQYSECEETQAMYLLPKTLNPDNWHEIQSGETVDTGHVSMTHTGNRLQEIHMCTPEASLRLTLVKGGTMISAVLRGEELFDRDAEYNDLTKLTRTKGNPNIFPVFNQMPAGVMLPGATQPLPNHGIARNARWTAYVCPTLPGALLLQLKSSDDTRAFYPDDFTYTQCLTLQLQSVNMEQHIITDGPFAVGFHPYFRVSNKRDIVITGIEPSTPYWYLPNALSKAEKDAVIAQDHSLTYVPGKEGSLDFASGEVNHHFDLTGTAITPIILTDPGLQHSIRIERSVGYNGLTVWCNADEERSVCIEPVTDRSGMLSVKSTPWQGWVRYTRFDVTDR